MSLVRILIISLTILFVNATTSLHELFFIPELLEHYEEHRKDGDLSFLEFLSLHYTNGTEHSHDSNPHENLPFKLHHVHFVSLQALNFPETNSGNEQTSIVRPLLVFSKYQLDILDSDLVRNVFHPPRG